jgi:hypothetical protein
VKDDECKRQHLLLCLFISLSHRPSRKTLFDRYKTKTLIMMLEKRPRRASLGHERFHPLLPMMARYRRGQGSRVPSKACQNDLVFLYSLRVAASLESDIVAGLSQNCIIVCSLLSLHETHRLLLQILQHTALCNNRNNAIM